LHKPAACQVYVLHPKATNFFQVACSVIYSVTCFVFPAKLLV